MGIKMRIGHGFDVHRFAPRVSEHKPLILGGVTLPDALSLEAHSDGDVVLHALCDALLGAIGEGDIGLHFPDTNAQYAGVSSILLVKQVCSLVSARGFALSNADTYLKCALSLLSLMLMFLMMYGSGMQNMLMLWQKS
jgi:2-C-methyl-D-erythritol 2,4-cyclodiphosphate synthase